jgi:enamine deaminase RidA (YjgF/YER057c/UK114 family)
VSGQVPTDEQGQVIVGGIEAQTRRVFVRLQEALAMAGCTLSDVAKVSVWLEDARDFAAFNRVYMECFGDHRPARSTVESRLMIDAKVEMDVTAYKPQ